MYVLQGADARFPLPAPAAAASLQPPPASGDSRLKHRFRGAAAPLPGRCRICLVLLLGGAYACPLLPAATELPPPPPARGGSWLIQHQLLVRSRVDIGTPLTLPRICLAPARSAAELPPPPPPTCGASRLIQELLYLQRPRARCCLSALTAPTAAGRRHASLRGPKKNAGGCCGYLCLPRLLHAPLPWQTCSSVVT